MENEEPVRRPRMIKVLSSPDLYDRARARAEAEIADVDQRLMAAPTPCEDWNVGALIDHMVGHVRYIETVREKDDDPDRLVPFREGIGEWRLDSALAATALELTTHTWDLARACGGDETIDPDVLATLWERFLSEGPGPPRGPGLIGPAVPIVASDPLQNRFLGQMGREPVGPVPGLITGIGSDSDAVVTVS